MDEIRVDASYRNTNNPRAEADRFNRFFRFADGKGINNTAGFRPKSRAEGSTMAKDCVFCALVTTLGEIEWPDSLDRESGVFIYYGDNRKPGRRVDDTNVGGNVLLETVYERLHQGDRDRIPPFLCFESFQGEDGKYMRFLGLAAPGASGVSGLDDLVAVWRMKGTTRFQNYRATMSILDVPAVSHAWLEDMVAGIAPKDSAHCPAAWRRWVVEGRYVPLRAERKIAPRERADQIPRNNRERDVLRRIYEGLSDREFEFAAAEVLSLMDQRYQDIEVTRAVRDGGRDVLARYRVGHDQHKILLDAYVEAKRWDPDAAIGVKPMMRLIARIKHRDFGVFVTTSHFLRQVQEELIEDRHPILLVSGGDLARLLIDKELEGPALDAWLVRIRSIARSEHQDHEAD